MVTETPSDEDSDEDLVRRIADDQDKCALEVLMDRCAPKAAGYLKKQFGKRLRGPEIEQAINDAAFNVWRFASKYDPARSFGSWFIRIVQRAALSIIRADKDYVAKELEFDPEHDPADHYEDEILECGSAGMTRVEIMQDIIENELTGFEQIVAQADVTVGGTADSKRLANEHGRSLNTVYATRTKVRDKIEKGILAREARMKPTKGRK